ncbi:MAG: lysylphosphatidylglycerol synthase transmembrane domain-containing protein [Acidimicrobiia bacterium]|nr:lysylphosphatidylglycerol synthase transmembrane domain-containing protein [Acidimicrobiia bacterium]MDX2468220.1 lysylphosphatidylglycerol synthase transmembrane domain-containing protein [Acidimicrobiia bacterium]
MADDTHTGYFLDTEGEPRVRRARDAVQIGIGVLLVLVAASERVRLSTFQGAVNSVQEALPGWSELLFWLGYATAGVYALVMVVVVVARSRTNPMAARDVVLAVGGAGVLAFLAMRLQAGVWPNILPEFGSQTPEPLFPIVRVAVVTAAVLVLSPHVTRTLRRFGSAMVVLSIVAGFGLQFGYPSDAIGGVGLGLVSAGVVLLAFGSPGGFPDRGEVTLALGQLGVVVHNLEPAVDQSWGTRRLVGVDDDDLGVEVKAYGRDAADTQWAAKLWRSLWYRDSGQAVAYTRMQAVEHEALMALFAEQAGVRVAEPLTAGLAGDDMAILAVRRSGTPLSDLAADEITDRVLVAIWRDLAALHDADVAHGSPRTSVIMILEDEHIFGDFISGTLGAGERTHLDVANLLFSLAALVGIERAVATAIQGLGNERLATTLPYLQLPALDRRIRREVRKPKPLMKDLKEAVSASTGTEVPDSAKLRRVSVGSLLMAVVMLVAANALISQLAGIDFAAVWSIVKDASPVGLVLAFVVAQSSFVPEATGMIAAVGRPIPLQPIVILQFAARFIGLAIPSAAGRVAMNSAFLVKFGVSTTTAVVQGAIDGVSGFAVEVGILLLALVLSDGSYALGSDTDWQAILLIAIGVVVVGVVVLFLVERLRRLILPVLKEALESVASVFREPRRAITLLASNFLSRLALAVVLWLILRSIGVEMSVAVVLTVTIATNLLAGLVPIPGGIGVAEAVMISWLVLVGVPEAPAFAATVVYRLCTFYIPAVEGFFALRWLEQRDYL